MKYLRAVGVFVSTLVIYLGTCLLGWGITKVNLFFSTTTRFGYALAVLLFSVIVGIQAFQSLSGIQDGKEESGQRVKRQSIIGAILVFSLFAGLFFIPFTSQRGMLVFPEIRFISWLGVALSSIGYGLIFWSGLALGRQYSAEVTLQKDHVLVTSGPYRIIRHPRYLGVILISLGLSFIFHAWLGVLITTFAVVLVFLRIHDEEQLLHQHFRKEWEDYCHKTWRMIPYIF